MGKTRRPSDEALHCSFCQKSQDVVAKLIGTPHGYPRAYICDECVTVCAAILEDDRPLTSAETEPDASAPHPLLSHPLASDLMECVAQWIRRESLGADAAEELAQLRAVAARMMNDGG